jgi:hypothetical protein
LSGLETLQKEGEEDGLSEDASWEDEGFGGRGWADDGEEDDESSYLPSFSRVSGVDPLESDEEEDSYGLPVKRRKRSKVAPILGQFDDEEDESDTNVGLVDRDSSLVFEGEDSADVSTEPVEWIDEEEEGDWVPARGSFAKDVPDEPTESEDDELITGPASTPVNDRKDEESGGRLETQTHTQTAAGEGSRQVVPVAFEREEEEEEEEPPAPPAHIDDGDDEESRTTLEAKPPIQTIPEQGSGQLVPPASEPEEEEAEEVEILAPPAPVDDEDDEESEAILKARSSRQDLPRQGTDRVGPPTSEPEEEEEDGNEAPNAATGPGSPDLGGDDTFADSDAVEDIIDKYREEEDSN